MPAAYLDMRQGSRVVGIILAKILPPEPLAESIVRLILGSTKCIQDLWKVGTIRTAYRTVMTGLCLASHAWFLSVAMFNLYSINSS